MRILRTVIDVIIAALIIAIFGLIIMRAGLVHGKLPEMEELKKVIMDNTEAGKFKEGTEGELKKNYSLLKDDVEDYFYLAPKTAMDASEVLIVRFRTPDEAKSFLGRVAGRRDSRRDMYASYRPLEAKILSDSVLMDRNTYVVFIASENAAELDNMLRQYFK